MRTLDSRPPARRRRLLIILLAINGLLLPFGCCPALLLCNAFNPMQILFVTEFTVENRTAEDVRVTPIGTFGPAGRRGPLPMYASTTPAFPSSTGGRFPVASGQSIVLRYDWDDVNFSELVVETADGQLRQLVVNPEPTKDQYRVPAEDHFVISDLGALAPVPDRVRTAFQHANQGWPALLMPPRPVAILMLLPAITFLLLLHRWRRIGARHQAVSTPPPPAP